MQVSMTCMFWFMPFAFVAFLHVPSPIPDVDKPDIRCAETPVFIGIFEYPLPR